MERDIETIAKHTAFLNYGREKVFVGDELIYYAQRVLDTIFEQTVSDKLVTMFVEVYKTSAQAAVCYDIVPLTYKSKQFMVRYILYWTFDGYRIELTASEINKNEDTRTYMLGYFNKDYEKAKAYFEQMDKSEELALKLLTKLGF